MISKSQVKYIQSLGQKKFRDDACEFVAEGPKIINEFLGEGILNPVAIYALQSWIDEQSHLLNKTAFSILHSVTDAELERLSFLSTPNKVVGIFNKPPESYPFQFSNTVFLILDGIQDPGNLGTIIRIADWFGVEHLLCSLDCADAFAPKVVQSTMGSIARVQLHYKHLLPFIIEHKDLKLFASTLGGKQISQLDRINEGAILIGNESKGISEELLALSFTHLTIPKRGKAESLNAAVATGIILSHLLEV